MQIATCIGCGCDDHQACPLGCWWLRVDYKKGKGVCSECEEHVKTWDSNEPSLDKVKDSGPIHYWFGLTYSSYLVLPRSILQSMPIEWQRKFVDLLEEAQEIVCQPNDNYTVLLKDKKGKFVKDPFRNYRYPPPMPWKEKI
ncbi:MAG: hypothetical protein KGI54_14055 [Pseudomonadota bacterium]|nr:hypothetical protein [Pseudomonadota bacterium]